MRMLHVKPTKSLGVSATTLSYTYVHRDHRNNLEQTQFDGTHYEIAQPTYVGNFIACEHPTLKWWESLFIPLDASGSKGISFTTWGRKGGVKGSAQAKIVTETEWFQTVTSKIGVGDYQVMAYAGRELGLHHNATTLYSQIPEGVRMPAFGLDSMTSADLIARISQMAVFKHLVDFTLNCYPTRDFLNKAALNGNSIHKHLDQMDIGHPNTKVYVAEIAKMFAEGSGDTTPGEPVEPSKPAIDRTALYSDAWGAFG